MCLRTASMGCQPAGGFVAPIGYALTAGPGPLYVAGMRLSSAAGVSLLLLVFVSACGPEVTSEPKVLKRLGNACAADAECGSGDCLHGACTRACASQGDCPWGLDCGVQSPDDEGPTCYLATYAQPNVGGFGTSCALFAGACGAAENPCAQGFTCRTSFARDADGAYQPVTCDPEAFCTMECARDTDCPATMFCGADEGDPSDDSDDTMRCLPRQACTPCATDDQCPTSWMCVLGVDGDRFCAKPCAQEADCLKAQKSSQTGESMFEPFEVCAPDRGDSMRTACQPAAGRCFGASPVPSQPSGGICAPCRENHPDDCAEGHACIESSQGEWFCTAGCTVSLTQAQDGRYSISGDTCPDGTYCYLGGYVPQGCGAGCSIDTICNGDPTYSGMSCMPSLLTP